jgi:pyridoxal phosphate enzyme (YggS family)
MDIPMLEDQIKEVQDKIQKALANRKEEKITGREVTILAVTKNHPASIVTDTLNAGLTHIGENRVQEAMHKQEVLPPGGIWHLIGHLQTNKVKHAVEHFAIIESVDSTKILEHIDKAAAAQNKVMDVLLQINEAREPQKSGFSPEEFHAVIPTLKNYSHIRVRGVMVIAQATDNVEETRPVFAAGYQDFVLLKKSLNSEDCNILSMGMTHDYWIAVEEGANEVRVGSALFGARDYSLKF